MQSGIFRLILVCMVYWLSIIPFIYKWGLSIDIRQKIMAKLKSKLNYA